MKLVSNIAVNKRFGRQFSSGSGYEPTLEEDGMSEGIEIMGEIIEASTSEFAAESKRLYSPPRFGSFVKAPFSPQEEYASGSAHDEEDPFDMPDKQVCRAEPAVYGVVYHASTGPVDTSRRVRAYWKDEEQLSREQPELSEWLLVTEFRAIIIGHSTGRTLQLFLPPQPPRLHSFVFPCTAEEIALITSKMDFLRTLANSRTAPVDEVIAACIREANAARGPNTDFLVAAGKELATLFKDDSDRLLAILRRVIP